ncbi:MAG: winged helix-turn-helix transcriptional regulator [Myxococcales bacterium]|nr:winged helix-turn-helix transcriptional regulator [Myxococcales bacterium]
MQTPTPTLALSVRAVVEELLERRSAVTNREVARKAGVTRQAVHRQLSRLVRLGVLRVEGHGRSVRYVRPASEASGQGGGFFGRSLAMWQAVVSAVPWLAYVRLVESGLALETRRDAQKLIGSLRAYRAAILDFRGIDRVGEPFARELLARAPAAWLVQFEPINMSAPVERMHEQVLAHEQARPPAPEREYKRKPRDDDW